MSEGIAWRTPGQEAEHLIDCLLVGLKRSGVSVILETSKSEYLLISGLPDVWQVEDNLAPDDVSLFGEEIAARLKDLKELVISEGESSSLEVSVGNDQVFEFLVEPLNVGDCDGFLVTTIVDMSEERRREKVLRALLRELSHRSKNLLAIIQSIAAQTARYSLTLDAFVGKFRGRLYSLSRSQDLITESNWRGARFHELVHQQLERYVAPELLGKTAKMDGENIDLSPNAALHIGLALHELIVNAVSHGSLSEPGEPVRISGERIVVDGSENARITWSERWENTADDDDTEDDPDQYFGSMVLERVVPTSVNGSAKYSLGPDEIRYELTFPVAEAEE